MTEVMLGRLPLRAVRGSRDDLEDQLGGSNGPMVLDQLKLFVKHQPCWITSRHKSARRRVRGPVTGKLGSLPLKAYQGTMAELERLLASPKGEIVRLELLKFVDNKPCWVERDEDIVVRNEHGHVILTVKGLRLRGDEEVDRLQATGYEVSEQAIRHFCADDETSTYGADQILEQGHKYTVVLVNQMSDAKKCGYHRPQAGIIPRLCEVIPAKVLRHLGINRIIAPHEPVNADPGHSYTLVVFELYLNDKGKRVVDVYDCHHGIDGDTATVFAYFVDAPPQQRPYVERVQLSRDDAEKALQDGTIIRVNRKISPVYPHWVVRALHPELEKVGAEEYDLEKIERWFHPKQKKDSDDLRFETIYAHLRTNNMLERCLGLRDGEEIMKRGHMVFKKVFGDIYQGQWCNIPLWKSVAEFRRRLPEGTIRDSDGDPDNLADQYDVYLRFAFISADFEIRSCWWPLSNTLGNNREWPTLLLPR